jgi:hypothetical protein
VRRAAAALCVASLAALLAWPQLAAAAEPAPGPVTEAEAIRTANRDPSAVKERGEHAGLTSSAHVVEGDWNVGYFAEGKELALVIVDSHTGKVRESWTGYQVAWKMARGYPGAFGESLNAPYVFLPLCALFLLGLVDWRRRRRLVNLDLLVLLGFGVSHYFFNRGEIGVSVPLAYPVLLYLLARALWIGFRGAGEGLRPVWPWAWLLVAALFLMGFRVGLNVADSGTTDIGYAGVIGADRIAHGEPIYGNFPEEISQGDTYGPVNYFAYVPFERIWPWSGKWDDLPASHAAAIVFDLATFCLLIWLGIRIRPGPDGRRLAATLAFGWAAYPYTAQVLESNSNDGLVALLLVATLLVLASCPRGDGGARHLGQVHPGGRGPDGDRIRTAPAPGPALRRRLRRGDRGGDAVAGDRPRPAHLLRAHDRIPGRPQLAVQHLGAGFLAGAAADRPPRRDRRALAAAGLPPAPQDGDPRRGARRRGGDRAADHHAPLVLPLHRLVLPAAPGGAGGAAG